MRVDRSVLAIVAVSCLGVVMPRSAAADSWNKETVLTFSQAVEIPSKVLPAGKYVFRLADSSMSRHIVQVFDQDGRLLASVLTIPAAQLNASDGTRVIFDEQAAGAPAPIKKWFYPGDSTGEEFIYSTHAN
jgi:hypothetical protein